MKRLVYFDHAATSYPKPPSVVSETLHAFSENGGNPGRSSHSLSRAAAEAVYKCRESVCRLLGFASPERVIFTQNATYALNIAIKGVVKPYTHVLISNFEHNSVIRPLHTLSKSGKGISCTSFDATGKTDGDIVSAFVKGIRNNTKTAVVTAASNVCGRIMPIKDISRICRERGIILIVDAAQAAGEIPIDFESYGADILCAAGHKGLYGPQGTGFLVISDRVKSIDTLAEGGNGLNSFDPEMGEELPERLEAGTVNTVGICGLESGISYVSAHGIESIYGENKALASYLADGLGSLDKVTLYGNYPVRTPVVLFNVSGLQSDEVASRLADEGFCVRSGLHCAPTAHSALKTGKYGAVRASLSFTNTKTEIDRFLKAVKKM